MSRQLPARPSLDHLKKQAKELLSSVREAEPQWVLLYRNYFPASDTPSLSNAQLVLAREYGFESWNALKRHVLRAATNGDLDEFVSLSLGGQLEGARKLLPGLGSAVSSDLVASAIMGRTEAVMELVGDDPELLSGPIGKLERPLLTYVCYSRWIVDPEFGPDIRRTCSALLEAGADPDSHFLVEWAGEPVRETALYGAAGVLNDPALTKLLLDAGADPNDGSPEDRYAGEALYHASEFPGSNECLRLILEAGPSQSAKDYCIKRKLDFEDMEGAKLYLDHGANPNANFRRTALSHAILRGRSLDILSLLLSYGADPNARDMDGTTAYGLSRRLGNKEAARLLEEHGAKTDFAPIDAILIAAAEGDENRAKELSARYPDAVAELKKQRDEDQPGPESDVLHDMARLGNVTGLRTLLDLGLDPGLRNGFTETPLHWACLSGRPDATRLLIERGAPLDVVERNHGGDPLGWAIWGSVNWKEPHGDYAGTIRTMLEAGASPAGRQGGSPEVAAVLRSYTT
jgi:ankyrin repeat protein